MTVQQNAAAIEVLRNDIVGLQEVIGQIIQRQPTQEQINHADKIAAKNAITCFGTFCDISARGINYDKASKCMRDCSITNACIATTQLVMVAKMHGISGTGENWKLGFPDGLGPGDL